MLSSVRAEEPPTSPIQDKTSLAQGEPTLDVGDLDLATGLDAIRLASPNPLEDVFAIVAGLIIVVLLAVVPTVLALRDLRGGAPDPGYEEPRRTRAPQ